MDNDERNRRDWPDEDRGDQPATPDWSAPREDSSSPPPADDTTAEEADWREPTQPTGPPEPTEATQPTDAWGEPVPQAPEPGAPAEIESWPSQEPAAAGQAADERGEWPTEPPAAGSAADDAWPTEPPERGDRQAAADEPDWPREPPSTAERAPEEVEAYPAAGAGDAAATAAAAHAVPDAEAATGESTQCPRCGTENRPGLSFCRNCGQRLVAAGVPSTVERPGAPEGTMACPRCGTHNRAGVAFCQNCGANLRGTAEGYVPPAAAAEEHAPAAEPARRGAILGPVVLLIGLAGLVTAYLLPFLYGPRDSLLDRAWGADGYGVAFWNGYPEVGASLADQAYFGLAAPVPLLGLLLLALAVAGFVRAAPGVLQSIGLIVALLWSVGLIVLFVVVELLANWSGDIVGTLRVLTPAGIIFFLSSLIVLIGTLTRFSRG